MRLGKAAQLAAIVIGIFASMIAFGYFYPYWRKVDQDIVLAYQGLLFNDGAPQSYFDHTGYIYYLLIGAWYAVLHGLGLLQAAALSAMPAPGEADAFNRAWTDLIRAGRVFSALLAGLFVVGFAAFIRVFLRDGRIALMAAFAMATSGSLMMHARIMRTELAAAFFTMAVLALALLAARESSRLRLAAWLTLAGACAVLAIQTKVQALIPLMTIPPLALFFGFRKPEETRRGWGQAAAITAAAALAALSAAGVIRRGFEQNAVHYAPLGPLPDGVYQTLLLIWPLFCVVLFSAIWRRGAAEAAIAAAALILGAAVGALALLLRFHPQNVGALTHPIEHMLLFAAGAPGAPGEAPATVFSALAAAVYQGVSAHTFFLNPSARPTLIAEWFAIGAAVVAWRRGAYGPAAQVGVLLGAAWAIDSAFSLRGIKDAYLLFSDPFLLIAAALMLRQFPELFASKAARRWAAGLAALALFWSHVEPIKLAFSQRGPEQSCEWMPAYVPGVTFPYCPAR